MYNGGDVHASCMYDHASCMYDGGDVQNKYKYVITKDVITKKSTLIVFYNIINKNLHDRFVHNNSKDLWHPFDVQKHPAIDNRVNT